MFTGIKHMSVKSFLYQFLFLGLFTVSGEFIALYFFKPVEQKRYLKLPVSCVCLNCGVCWCKSMRHLPSFGNSD